MRQYEDYQIFINVPPRAVAEKRAKEISEAAAKNDFKRTAYLRNVQKYRDELEIDPRPDALALDYEKHVVKHLNRIKGTQIGKVTLDSINKAQKLWILPLKEEDRKDDCDNCAAYVFPAPPSEGGGIRLYYSPAADLIKGKWVISSDDTFYHELFHALRWSWSSSWSNSVWINGYRNEEEFVATIMENMYRASKGEKLYYSKYVGPDFMDKDLVYDFYAQDVTLIPWFKRCTFSDSFIWAMARRTDTAYNPWRDREQLERKWLRANRRYGLKKFPE